MPGMLPRIGLTFEGTKVLTLTLPNKFKDLMGERVEKRLASLAFEVGRTPRVVIGGEK
jgi:exopolyphosphatase / guanosine-5'-triphosphate,3'-diphosphate pyrophosphatase